MEVDEAEEVLHLLCADGVQEPLPLGHDGPTWGQRSIHDEDLLCYDISYVYNIRYYICHNISCIIYFILILGILFYICYDTF